MALACIGNCVMPRLMRINFSISTNPTYWTRWYADEGSWGRTNCGSYAESGKACGLVILSVLWRLSRPGVDLWKRVSNRRVCKDRSYP
eukprot:7227213-Pyramimonas_sp.AAC.1